MRSTGCASSRDSLPLRVQRTRRRTRRRKKRAMGVDPTKRWSPPPPSPRAAEAAEGHVPATRRSVEEAARTVEAPMSIAGASTSAAAAATGVVGAPPEPSRKRKRGFSGLR
jgi:hypothetical protein